MLRNVSSASNELGPGSFHPASCQRDATNVDQEAIFSTRAWMRQKLHWYLINNNNGCWPGWRASGDYWALGDVFHPDSHPPLRSRLALEVGGLKP